MFFDNIRIIFTKGNILNKISNLPLANFSETGAFAGVSAYAYELAAGYLCCKYFFNPK